ncbi:hypothetical protein K3495_g13583 [Podosphaera aphanis]|nr:hypothetical protein K3495_g13583 [Podosphaera aphanis]
MWAWPIYNKKTVSTTVQHFLEHLHKQHNKTPKRIHTDSGTEFSNSAFQEILQSRGIEWSKSSSHAPEQNRIAERNVRTVTEKMRVLHIQSGLPLKLWPLILNAAINILNITLNVHASKSPFFAVYNKTPNIKNLHHFGCRAFWPDPEQNKLKQKKVFTTVTRRDIRVHENSFPLRTRILALQSSSRRDLEKVLSGPRAKEWNIAMDKEINNMTQNKVWTLVPRSEAKGELMTGRWSFKEKSDGSLKARWCARGFSEPFVDNTYADILPPTTMRLLLAFAACKNLHIRHIDITAAFLHADIDRPLYIEQPHSKETTANFVYKLHKAIYGLKTAPRRWQEKLRKFLKSNGFQSFKFDPNLFRRPNIIISTYVDDFMIVSSSQSLIDETVSTLAKAFQIIDLGDMTKFLGINIERRSDGIRIHKQHKIKSLCDDMNLLHCNGTNTPISDDNLLDRDTENLCTEHESAKYRSAVGTLLHISNMTRPDIQYAVNRLTQRMQNPSQNAMLSLKNLVRYVSRTKSAALFFC